MSQVKKEIQVNSTIGTYIEEIADHTDGLGIDSPEIPEALGEPFVQLVAAWMKDRGMSDVQCLYAYGLLEKGLRLEFIGTLALLAVLLESEQPHDLH